MSTHEEPQLYTDPEVAIDRCILLFQQPANCHRVVAPAVARALCGGDRTPEPILDRVWEMVAQIKEHRQGIASWPGPMIVQHLPLAPLLELAGRLAWHSTRRFVDDAPRAEKKHVTHEERCLFLLSLADGLRVFRDNDKEKPKPPQSSCAERAKEVLEVWAPWVINGDLLGDEAEKASNWIKQNPSCLGYPLLLETAERIERGEFVLTSAGLLGATKTMVDLDYAMQRLILETHRPFGAPVVISRPLRIMRALAAIAQEDEEVKATYGS
jgi:hypothetical protein